MRCVYRAFAVNLIIGVLSVVFCGSASPTLLDSFDTLGGWKDPNYSGSTNADGASTFTIVSSPKREGTGAGDLYYVWGSGNFIREINGTQPTIPADSVLSVWIYGDSSGNEVRLCVRDEENELFSNAYTAIDFTGWRQLKWQLQYDPFFWYANVGDKLITGNPKWDSIMVRKVGTQSTGHLYFDEAEYSPILETPTPTPTGILNPNVQKGPFLQMQEETSARVIWITDIECGNNEVEWGLTSGYGNTASDVVFRRRHEVEITGLAPDTLYHYRIKSEGKVLSGDKTMRTAPPATSEQLTFTIQGDSRAMLNVCREIFEAMLPASINGFALSNGDIVGRGEDCCTDWWQTQFFNPAGATLAHLFLYPTIGNHEAYNENAEIVYPSQYVEMFSLPMINSGTEVYYSFDKANVHFVCLDNWFSNYNSGSAQYNWLKNDLASTNKRWKIVWAHNGPYISRDGALQGDALFRSDIVPLLEGYEVNFFTNGHYHIYQRNDVKGIKYLVQGTSGDFLGAQDYSQAFVEFSTSDYYTFTKIEIDGPVMTGTTKTAAGALIDAFEVHDYVLVDDGDPGFSLNGTWTYQSSMTYTEAIRYDYYYVSTSSTETRSVEWRPNLDAGIYDVYVRYRMGSNRAPDAPYTVYYSGGSQTVPVNQTVQGGQWVLLGRYPFDAGSSGYVKLANGPATTGKNVIADAVKWLHVQSFPDTPTPSETPTAIATASQTPVFTPTETHTVQPTDTPSPRPGTSSANHWEAF